MKRIFILLLLSLHLLACASAEKEAMAASEGMADMRMAKSAVAQDERKIIKQAWLTLEVDNFEKPQQVFEQYLKTHGGYVVSTSQDNEGESQSFTLKVDSKRLDDFIQTMKTQGKVLEERVWTTDVTEEFMDNEARLKNLYALRDKIRNLLEKASTVEDILSIERELSRIQSEIDALEGRMKYLNNAVDFSEVQLTLKQKTQYGPLGYVAVGLYWAIEKLFVWD